MLKEYFSIKIQELETEKNKLNKEKSFLRQKKYSILDRFFLKRKATMDSILEDKERQSDIDKKLADLDKKIELLTSKQQGKEAFLKYCSKRLEKIEEDIKKTSNSQYIPFVTEKQIADFKEEKIALESEMGSYISIKTCKDLLELVKQGKIEWTFDGDDKDIGEVFMLHKDELLPEFSSLDDFMLVHKTDYLPMDDKLRTPKSTQARELRKFDFRGKTYEIEYRASNDTTHFALNGPVSDNNGGTWSQCKYGILVGFNDINRDNLNAVRVEDTFFDGDVSLGEKYFILMPRSEFDNMDAFNSNLNPNATIVPYEGMTLDEAIYSLISLTGRRAEEIGNDKWLEGKKDIGVKDFNDAKRVLIDNGIPFGKSHFTSESMMKRQMERRANIIISIFEFLNNKGLNPTTQELMGIMKKLTGAAVLQFNEEENSLFDKYYLSTLRENGYNIPQDIWNDKRFNMGNIDRKDSKLDILDEYVCQALKNGKTKEAPRELQSDE